MELYVIQLLLPKQQQRLKRRQRQQPKQLKRWQQQPQQQLQEEHMTKFNLHNLEQMVRNLYLMMPLVHPHLVLLLIKQLTLHG
jgi:hypothetical protein